MQYFAHLIFYAKIKVLDAYRDIRDVTHFICKIKAKMDTRQATNALKM